MFINEIVDIINNTIDIVFSAWISKTKPQNLIDFNNLINEQNFVKFQKEINESIDLLLSTIDENKIKKIVSKTNNITLIKNITSKFVCYYIFIFLGLLYKSKIELFNNNIIEFSRNQHSFKLKIDNFFNSDSNSNIFKSIKLINELYDYSKQYSDKSSFNLLNSYSKDFQQFIFDFNNKDNLNKYNKQENNVENNEENKKENNEENEEEKITQIINLINRKDIDPLKIKHSIIKFFILFHLFKPSERKELFNIIEASENSNGEFIFIDVLVPKSMFIDYDVIEQILDPKQITTNLPDRIYKLINEDYEETLVENRKFYTDHESKIQKLFDTHIIIPIVDDFLLYHKNEENYEKKISDDSKQESNIKKKQDTKIKYIIEKINSVANLYNQPNNIDKFDSTHKSRNAVAINEYEDLKIISKTKNMKELKDINLDNFRELLNLRIYPYISFKDFKNHGFVFMSDKSHESIRNVSFNQENFERNKILQTRIISKDLIVNIVGFAVLSNKENIQCVNMSSMRNITKDYPDPLKAIKMLIDKKIDSKLTGKHSSDLDKNYFWLFDLDKQNYKIPYYDISERMPKNEIIKITASYLYDYTLETILSKIKDFFKSSNSSYLPHYINILDNIKSKFNDLNNNQFNNQLNELEYMMYQLKTIYSNNKYDEMEDEFTGLYGNVYKLPLAIPKKLPDINIIKVSNQKIINSNLINSDISDNIKNIDFENFDYNDNSFINAVCQHNISWQKLAIIQKDNYSLFNTLIYEFIQNYVEIGIDDSFICKSCKQPIDIKKYDIEGHFDDKTHSFVTLSISIDINLDELPEYENYKTSIRNIEKIIERIATVLDVQSLIGSTSSIRSRRKALVKNSLDLILNNNKYLAKNKYQELIKNKIGELYGINKNLSNLFIFTLTNDVFIYSSKDKDFYKLYKYNNILAYIIFVIILEFNDIQIETFKNDKICSYSIFRKVGYTLFDNLNIIINKSRETHPINKYPILCYIIFSISCFLTKYNIWIDTISTTASDSLSSTTVSEKKKFNPLIQKSIIHTLVEIMNSVLNIDIQQTKNDKIYLYEILTTKYYLKLDLYKDPNLIKKLDKMYLSEDLKDKNTSGLIETDKFNIIPDNNVFSDYHYDDLYEKKVKNNTFPRFIIENTKKVLPLNVISNLTNCVNGTFHKFKPDGKIFKCLLCNEEANTDKYIKDSTKFISEKHLFNYFRKLALKYCKDGKLHLYQYSIKDNKELKTCKLCNYIYGETVKLNDKELKTLYEIISTNIINNNKYINDIIQKSNIKNSKKLSETKDILQKIIYKFNKYDNNIENTINTLIDNIQKITGENIDKFHLRKNKYIFSYDHQGNELKNQNKEKDIIELFEDDKNIRIIENHSFYKKDVLLLSYKFKSTNYEIFYDLYEKYLLGYRETSKDYVINLKSNIKFEIIYSIKNLFLLFGFPREKITIYDIYPETIGMTSDLLSKFINNLNLTKFTNKICGLRFNLLKKLGCELKKYIYRIHYKFNILKFDKLIEEKSFDDKNTSVNFDSILNNPLDLAYHNYFMKFKDQDINISKQFKDNKIQTFLKHITDISIFMPFSNLSIQPDKKYAYDFNFFLKHDKSSNLILNYILDEIIRLLDFNNKNTNENIIHFIINILSILTNNHNIDKTKFNKHINHFSQILYTSEFYLETQNNQIMVDAIDFFEDNHNIPSDEKSDAEEEDTEFSEAIKENNTEDSLNYDSRFSDVSEINKTFKITESDTSALNYYDQSYSFKNLNLNNKKLLQNTLDDAIEEAPFDMEFDDDDYLNNFNEPSPYFND
jgi:hypothetical protein